jgi:hypothetical protein
LINQRKQENELKTVGRRIHQDSCLDGIILLTTPQSQSIEDSLFKKMAIRIHIASNTWKQSYQMQK